MTWSAVWNAFLNGVVPGVVASAIFLFILFMLKPKIVISDKIASHYRIINGTKHHVYLFKIINKSLFFKVYDLKANAFVCENIQNVNGVDTKYTDITLKGVDQWVLNSLNFRHILQNFLRKDKTLQSRCDYAAQFVTFDNVATLLQNNSYISLQILAKHSLTGFSRVKIMKYQHHSKIEKGAFLSGNSCKIVQISEPIKQ